ncbi:hypothetical protein [Streptomyces sp. NPDC021622]|uniref:hypothetical protein n=1 Tax=Streptomyces sp. NPDC021622 TaxID=3155013 RepID=UPI0033C4E6E8
MFYTDISTWSEEKRREWIQRIINLAHEDRITSALRISLSALKDLETQQSDEDVARFLRMLTEVAGRPVAGVSDAGGVGASISAGAAEAVDLSIQSIIEYIIETLENPESWPIDRKKSLLRRFVILDWDRDFVTDNRTPIMLHATGITVTMLRPYADKAEETLGGLLALQHRIFPDLPTPFWIWQPE